MTTSVPTVGALVGSAQPAPPPVVLVPGLSGRTDRDYAFLAPMLERRRAVFRVEFDGLDEESTDIGAGARNSLDPLVERIADAVSAARHQGGGDPVVIGYSIGAVAAAAYAARASGDAASPSSATSPTISPAVAHPLAALVLIAGWLRPSPKLRTLARVWNPLRLDHPAELADVYRSVSFSAEGWDAAVEPHLDDETGALLTIAAQTDVAGLAERIPTPTLVIGCAADEIATTRQSRLLFGAIPDARYREIDSGHAVVHERPAELLDAIDGFLGDPRRHPAGTILAGGRP